MKKIEVFDSENNLVAADEGTNVTIESLREKMLHKIDINNEGFNIVETDTTIEHENKKAREKRRGEYPSIGDQLDVIWKHLDKIEQESGSLVVEAKEMLNSIKSVKDKYPKE